MRPRSVLGERVTMRIMDAPISVFSKNIRTDGLNDSAMTSFSPGANFKLDTRTPLSMKAPRHNPFKRRGVSLRALARLIGWGHLG